MVKLYTSLLAVTLATGSALASSDDYQRRSEEVQQDRQLRFGLACARYNNLRSRGFADEEDLFVRDDAFHKDAKTAFTAFIYGSQMFAKPKQSRGLEDDEDLFVRDLDVVDDLEAREPLNFKSAGSIFNWGKKAAKHKHAKTAFKAVDYGSQMSQTYSDMKQSRGLEDDEDLFVRDLDAFDDLEARTLDLKSADSIINWGRTPAQAKPKRAKTAFTTADSIINWGRKPAQPKRAKTAFKAPDYVPSQPLDLKSVDSIINWGRKPAMHSNLKQARGLEEDEDLFGRDLDTVDDLEAREPLNFKTAGKVVSWGTKVSEHKHTQNAMKAVDYGSQIYGAYGAMKQSRSLEDDEDLFVRDLDAEELFGREYDLLDERDTIDDLD
jgi:hypothetical protein